MTTTRPTPRFRPYEAERGISGFLLLFVITQLATIVLSLSGVPTTLAAFRADSWALGERAWLYRPLIVFEALAQAARLMGMVVGLALLLRTRPTTPRFYRIFLAAIVVTGLVDAIGTWFTFGQVMTVLSQSGGNTLVVARENAVIQPLRMAGYAAIWLLYWRQSERVDNTFRAMDA